MSGVLESSIYALWVAAQKDKATAAIVADKRLIQVGGDIDNNRDDGSENWSDGSRFGSQTDFVNTIVGTGAPVVEAQSDESAFLCWLFFGAEVFTAKVPVTSPPKYVFTPGVNTGYWSTWWKKVGLSTILRQKFNQCKITSLRFEGSTANKIVKVTPNVISLDPGEVFAVDPVRDFGIGQPFVYTEGEGTFTLDGVVYRGQSQFAIVCDDGGTPLYGDSPVPYAIGPGNAAITLDGITITLDDLELARLYTQVYGTSAPAPGAKPIHNIPAIGSYSATLTKLDSGGDVTKRQSLKIEVPGVKWSPSVATAPNPDGGAIEHAIAGQMRLVAGQPEVRVTIETGAGDNAAHTLPA